MYRVFLLAMMLVSSAAQGAEQIVWQIGKAGPQLCRVRHRRQPPGVRRPVRGKTDRVRSRPQQPGPGLAVYPARPAGSLVGRQRRAALDHSLPIAASSRRASLRLRIEFVDTQSTVPPRYVVALGRSRRASSALRPERTKPRSPTRVPARRRNWRSWSRPAISAREPMKSV